MRRAGKKPGVAGYAALRLLASDCRSFDLGTVHEARRAIQVPRCDSEAGVSVFPRMSRPVRSPGGCASRGRGWQSTWAAAARNASTPSPSPRKPREFFLSAVRGRRVWGSPTPARPASGRLTAGRKQDLQGMRVDAVCRAGPGTIPERRSRTAAAGRCRRRRGHRADQHPRRSSGRRHAAIAYNDPCNPMTQDRPVVAHRRSDPTAT